MYQSETMSAVRDAAETLTREGKVLTTGNPEFPLAVFADTYKVDDEPTNSDLPPEEIVAIEEHFDEINQESTGSEDDQRESIVSNLYTAVAKVQFNTTNIIIPSIKAMHGIYAGMQSASCEPEYAVRAWRYLAPHNSATLVNHINTRYTTVQPKDSLRSFHLENQTADAIIEMMAVNNPHLDQEEITEWALQVGSARLEAVWTSLFGSGGVVVPSGLSYLSAMSAPFNVDDILAAYFICGHYIDNPVVVPGESVDLDEWEHTMKVLHEMFGFYLTRAYTRRADQREQGLMILTNEAVNPIETRRAVVICNGDVFDPWVVAGGDIQAILGACVENSGITDARHLDANSVKFIARWHAIYPMIKQAAIDFSDRQRVSNVIEAFREVARSELLKERYTEESEPRLLEALSYVRRSDYDNPYKVFSSLICRVYFPEATYLEYLDAIDQYGQDFPKATVRELATQAMITLVAIFQAKQIITEMFMPEIDPEGEPEEGQFHDSGLLAIAGDEAESEVESTDMTTEGEDLGTLDGGEDASTMNEEGGFDTEGTDGITGDEGSSDTGLGEASADDIVGEDETTTTEVEDDFVDTEDEVEEDPYAELETGEEEEESTDSEVEEEETTTEEEPETTDDEPVEVAEVEETEEESEVEGTEESTEEVESEEEEVEDEEDDDTPLEGAEEEVVTTENFTEADLDKMKDRLVEAHCESDYMVDALLDHPEKAGKVLGLYSKLYEAGTKNSQLMSEFEKLCMYNYGSHTRDNKQLVDETISKLEALKAKYVK